MAMFKELPEDLVTQILLWLPVVSLLRFKCVCKSWYALITHQNFITKHLLQKKKNSNNRSNTQLLLKLRDLRWNYVVYTLDYETLQVSLTQSLPPLFSFGDYEEGGIYVVGSCNGLVCLHGNSIYEFNVVIWNPATKETKVVPESNVPPLACIGFGFDAKTNDYKIINIRFLFHPHSNSRNYPYQNYSYQKAVYSLNADSWRIVDWEHRRVHFLTDDYKGPMTYVNGVASWRVLGDGYDWGGVLSFDMSDEVFLETPLPDVVMRNRHPNFWEELFLLNESIAMAVSTSHSEDWSNVCFDIWLLLEVGVKDSWTKLFTIGPGIPRPLGFWKNGTMFLENVNGLVLYDPSTKEMTDLQIHHRHRDSMQLVTYMETLVSVKGGNGFEEQDI